MLSLSLFLCKDQVLNEQNDGYFTIVLSAFLEAATKFFLGIFVHRFIL